jgi:hypothetical protein
MHDCSTRGLLLFDMSAREGRNDGFAISTREMRNRVLEAYVRL